MKKQIWKRGNSCHCPLSVQLVKESAAPQVMYDKDQSRGPQEPWHPADPSSHADATPQSHGKNVMRSAGKTVTEHNPPSPSPPFLESNEEIHAALTPWLWTCRSRCPADPASSEHLEPHLRVVPDDALLVPRPVGITVPLPLSLFPQIAHGHDVRC